MALLIRNGLLMTMTDAGVLHADVMIDEGKISQIGTNIPDAGLDEHHILDANGLVLMPGLIDLNIDVAGADTRYIAEMALYAGITTHLQRADGRDAPCLLWDGCGMHMTDFLMIEPSFYTDEQLSERLHRRNARAICTIRSSEACRRVMQIAGGAANVPILADLIGCQDMAEDIAGSGCPVIVGVHRKRHSPWAMAARLDALGVKVAISSSYPASQMKLLPVCAGLCLRDGMPHEHALRAITAAPADILCLTDRGRLAAGMAADITLFDGDPLLLSTSHVMTIAGGRIIKPA